MPTSHVHRHTQTMKLKNIWIQECMSCHWLCDEACSTTPRVSLVPKVKPSAKRRDVFETISRPRQKTPIASSKRTTRECWLSFLVKRKHVIFFVVVRGEKVYTLQIPEMLNYELLMVFFELFLCWIAVGFALCSLHVVFLLFFSRSSRNSYSL